MAETSYICRAKLAVFLQLIGGSPWLVVEQKRSQSEVGP